MTTRLQKTKKNMVSSLIQNVINLIVALGGRIIFVQVLNSSYLGINGLFSNVLNILSLADLGMATVMMYHLYKPIAENDANTIVALTNYFKKIYLGIAATVFLIGIALIPFLDYIINLPMDIPDIYLYYIVALLNVVISYLFVYRTTLVSADQKTYVLNKYLIIFKIIIFIAQTAVLFIFRDYLLYLLVALFLNFLCNVVQNKVALELYPFLREKKNYSLSKDVKNDIFKNIKATFLYKICGIIQSNTDSILTSIFVGTICAGYYSNYILIINQIVLVIGIFFNSAKASVGNVLALESNDIENKWKLFNIFELLDFGVVGFSAICFFSLSNPFIELAFGSEYILPTSIVFAITLNFYTSNIRQTIWMFRETSGMFEPMKYITAVTAVINLGLSIVFGYLWGMFGIIIATVIARMVYAWWKEPKILYEEFFKKNPESYYITYVKRLSLCCVLSFVTWWINQQIQIDNNIVKFLVNVTISIVLSLGTLFLIYRNGDSFVYIVDKLLKRK